MHIPGINGERELRGQPANPGSAGKMAVKMECVCLCSSYFCGVLKYAFNPLVPSVPKMGHYKKLGVRKRHSIFK